MKKRFFQYLAGPRQKEVVEFKKIEQEDGINFVTFKDNSRCNEELILSLNNHNWTNQLMAEVENHQNVWNFKEEWIGREEEKWAEDANGKKVCVQPFQPGKKKITPYPPKPSKSKFGQIDEIEEEAPKPKKEKQDFNDPVWLMMDKAKKFDTDVEMTLTISLPSKHLYNVADESFEEGGEKVIKYIIKNMDNEKIQNSLSNALKNAYRDDIKETHNDGLTGTVSMEDSPNRISTSKQQNKDDSKENDGIESYIPKTVESAKVSKPQLAKENNDEKSNG